MPRSVNNFCPPYIQSVLKIFIYIIFGPVIVLPHQLRNLSMACPCSLCNFSSSSQEGCITSSCSTPCLLVFALWVRFECPWIEFLATVFRPILTYAFPEIFSDPSNFTSNPFPCLIFFIYFCGITVGWLEFKYLLYY